MARSSTSQPLRDHRALDWLALSAATRIVTRVQDHQLELPTPCAKWSVRELVRHMVGNNAGFALAACGATPDRVVWEGVYLPGDARGGWDGSVQQVVTAFSRLTDLSTPVSIPGYGEVPAAQAIGMHFIDYLTHGWDLAVSIGVEPNLDEESCREVLRMAATWPAGHPAIWGPGAAFGFPVEVSGIASAADQMLALLGRSPTWARSRSRGPGPQRLEPPHPVRHE